VSIIFIQLSSSTALARQLGGANKATLPAGIMMAASVISATPGVLLMAKHGRRPVMLVAAILAVFGAALMCVASKWGLLTLLIVGSIPLGVSFAQANNLRFVALEFAPLGSEPRSLSFVVTGAVLSAVVGPEVARHTRYAMATPYVATYIFVTGLCVLYVALMLIIEFSKAPLLARAKAAAAACINPGTVTVVTSSPDKAAPDNAAPDKVATCKLSTPYCPPTPRMMTATPLALVDAGYDFNDTTQVIQVHILSMFVPSLFTGEVIRLLSAQWTMAIGAVALLGGTATFFAGTSASIFFAANSVVGMGWNWAFVGASVLVSGTYTSDERFIAQGLMDSLVLLGTGISVVLSGTLYGWLGWTFYTVIYMVVNGLTCIIDVIYVLLLIVT
ncbi:putative MFS-type transporter YdeG, partial [Tetrabaena socialis]